VPLLQFEINPWASYRKGMKSFWIAASLAALAAVSGSAQQANVGSATATEKITIKLLNGKTGRPVWWRGLAYVRVGNAIGRTDLDSLSKRTNLLGEAEVNVSDADPPLVEIGVDFISRDCRYAPKASVQPLIYSIYEIRAKGVVSDNYCGGPKRGPKPGVLMIYVIPSTFWELWNE
jgi:hypothetical protein